MKYSANELQLKYRSKAQVDPATSYTTDNEVTITTTTTENSTRKLARTGLTVDSSELTFMPNSKSRDTKTRPNIKNPARSNLDIVP